MSDAPYGERRAVSPRFLPPDPAVEAPYRLTPGLALRVGILGAIALAVFAVLFFRLWSLQVLSGETYLAAAQGNQLRTIRIEAPRGTILDRDGRVIVDNVPGTAVKLWVGDERLIAVGEGNGPVNALDQALRRVLDGPYPQLAHIHLTDYRVRILDTEADTDAVVRVLIDSTDGDRAWTTIGVSTNIIEASWQALTDALVWGLVHST